jgi:surface polysaccharide O-acyltransferase-like enzyme
VEPYLIAARSAIFGNSTFLLALVPALLSVGSGLLTWRIARRLVADPALAALAAAAAWVAPQSVSSNATYEYGFRATTLLLGLLLVLVALRILDRDRRLLIFVSLGLVAGVGWWSSPEIVYFVVPAALLIVGAIAQDRTVGNMGQWLRDLLMAALAAAVGALP